jgi:hypothetical protein
MLISPPSGDQQQLAALTATASGSILPPSSIVNAPATNLPGPISIPLPTMQQIGPLSGGEPSTSSTTAPVTKRPTQRKNNKRKVD